MNNKMNDKIKDKINLVSPSKKLEQQALEYRKEHFDFGEFVINGSELFDKINDYNEWLNRVILNSNAETVSSDWVLTDTFFAIRESDKKVVGIVDLRYQLNEFLKDFGHCGYSVRPTERNKGYATEILAQICKKAKNYGLKRLQLAVEKSNIPSIRTILKNGGQYSRSFCIGEEIADIYFIDL